MELDTGTTTTTVDEVDDNDTELLSLRIDNLLPRSVDDCSIQTRRPILDRRIRLIKHIGSGAQGAVYSARFDDDLDRQLIAVKYASRKPSCVNQKNGDTVCQDSLELEFRAYALLAELDLPTIPRVFGFTHCGDKKTFLISEFIENAKPFYDVDDEVLLNALDTLIVFVVYTLAQMESLRISHTDLHGNNLLIQSPPVDSITELSFDGKTIDMRDLIGFDEIRPYVIDFGLMVHERDDETTIAPSRSWRSGEYRKAQDLRTFTEMLLGWFPDDVTFGGLRRGHAFKTILFFETLYDDAFDDRKFVTGLPKVPPLSTIIDAESMWSVLSQ